MQERTQFNTAVVALLQTAALLLLVLLLYCNGGSGGEVGGVGMGHDGRLWLPVRGSVLQWAGFLHGAYHLLLDTFCCADAMLAVPSAGSPCPVSAPFRLPSSRRWRCCRQCRCCSTCGRSAAGPAVGALPLPTVRTFDIFMTTCLNFARLGVQSSGTAAKCRPATPSYNICAQLRVVTLKQQDVQSRCELFIPERSCR